MSGILGPSPGDEWLTYVGVPDHYPQFSALVAEVDDAMWEAARDVLRDRAREDPLLRVLADDRCALWETRPCPAGDLSAGTEFTIDASNNYHYKTMRATGRIRALNPREAEEAADLPRHYADRVGVDWITYTGDWTGCWPHITRSTVVVACLPIPFDLSALLTVIDAEQNTPPPRPPASKRRRAPRRERTPRR